eukprot:355707-Chlamydomonas_euryale.AAC.2
MHGRVDWYIHAFTEAPAHLDSVDRLKRDLARRRRRGRRRRRRRRRRLLILLLAVLLLFGFLGLRLGRWRRRRRPRHAVLIRLHEALAVRQRAQPPGRIAPVGTDPLREAAGVHAQRHATAGVQHAQRAAAGARSNAAIGQHDVVVLTRQLRRQRQRGGCVCRRRIHGGICTRDGHSVCGVPDMRGAGRRAHEHRRAVRQQLHDSPPRVRSLQHSCLQARRRSRICGRRAHRAAGAAPLAAVCRRQSALCQRRFRCDGLAVLTCAAGGRGNGARYGAFVFSIRRQRDQPAPQRHRQRRALAVVATRQRRTRAAGRADRHGCRPARGKHAPVTAKLKALRRAALRTLAQPWLHLVHQHRQLRRRRRR